MAERAHSPALFREAFSAEVVAFLGQQVGASAARSGARFDPVAFGDWVMAELPGLSYGDRARRITEGLERQLTDGFPAAARILVGALGPEPGDDRLVGFQGLYILPLTGYVARNGLSEEHLDLSFGALYEMTKRFTAETDIRPFLIRYPEPTLAFLAGLTRDPSPFARRLASEGTRPRLPLAPRLAGFQVDPSPAIALLDRLCDDENLMVRRSVANNVNDISKDNPAVAVATVARWLAERPGPRVDFVVRHGLRTLIKAGHPGALELLGFDPDPPAVSHARAEPDRLRIGDALRFQIELAPPPGQASRVALNYVIHFRKSNGRTSPKVFRMPDKRVPAGARVVVERTHWFRPYRNQRFYTGPHALEITANGHPVFRHDFWLDVPGDPGPADAAPRRGSRR